MRCAKDNDPNTGRLDAGLFITTPSPNILTVVVNEICFTQRTNVIMLIHFVFCYVCYLYIRRSQSRLSRRLRVMIMSAVVKSSDPINECL